MIAKHMNPRNRFASAGPASALKFAQTHAIDFLSPAGSLSMSATPCIRRLLALLLLTSFLTQTGRPAKAQTTPAQQHEQQNEAFVCPETLPSDAARKAAVGDFVRGYAQQHPNNTVREAMIARYRLLTEHSCLQTLKSMLTSVIPLTQMLSFENATYGPRTEEFDHQSAVLTLFFRKDAEPPELSPQDLIFNFYGWQPRATPRAVAEAFLQPRENTTLLGKFEAPDESTKKPAYFLVSQTAYPEDKFAYVNLTKVAEADTGAFAVTFARKFTAGTIAEAMAQGKAWLLSPQGQAAASALGRVAVGDGWQAYLDQARK